MTIRDQSTRTLGEALALGLRGDPTPGYRHTPRTDRQYEALAERILAASPTLAADIDLATAWRMAGPEGIARLFHETYERLAPDHGYETRHESAVPWEDVPERNRGLMTATVVALTAALRDRAR